MSIYRTAAKSDSVCTEIVEGLRKAGVIVFHIRRPCDLLCYVIQQVRWQTLEVKTAFGKSGKPRKRYDQKEQDEFLALTKTPVVTSLEGALSALGLVQSPNTSVSSTSTLSGTSTASADGR